MDNKKTPTYYLNKIIKDICFIVENTKNVSLDMFTKNELLNNAASFRFIQISENLKQIPQTIILEYPSIPWHKISGLRNKIVHDYGSVKMDIIYYTAVHDLPELLIQLEELVKLSV